MTEQEIANFIYPHVVEFSVAYFVILVFGIVSIWKLFKKAGEPGWASLIPIYNVIVFMRVAKMSLWWLLLILGAFIPILGYGFAAVFNVMQSVKLAQAFNKGTGFALGLFFLSFIFIPILAFGRAKHVDMSEA